MLWVPQEDNSGMELASRKFVGGVRGIPADGEWGKQLCSDAERELWCSRNKGLTDPPRNFGVVSNCCGKGPVFIPPSVLPSHTYLDLSLGAKWPRRVMTLGQAALSSAKQIPREGSAECWSVIIASKKPGNWVLPSRGGKSVWPAHHRSHYPSHPPTPVGLSLQFLGKPRAAHSEPGCHHSQLGMLSALLLPKFDSVFSVNDLSLARSPTVSCQSTSKLRGFKQVLGLPWWTSG